MYTDAHLDQHVINPRDLELDEWGIIVCHIYSWLLAIYQLRPDFPMTSNPPCRCPAHRQSGVDGGALVVGRERSELCTGGIHLPRFGANVPEAEGFPTGDSIGPKESLDVCGASGDVGEDDVLRRPLRLRECAGARVILAMVERETELGAEAEPCEY